MANRVQLAADYLSVIKSLNFVAEEIEKNLKDIFSEFKNLDRIAVRVKGKESYLNKALKEVDSKLKYNVPLKEIQDLIGARIVVFYKTDVQQVLECIDTYFPPIEHTVVVPDEVSKFGYEGVHNICLIQSFMYPDNNVHPLMPTFFELQIKTLYQHAWSQANHGLGYKPDSPLEYDEERKLAFLSAQSWGADKILEELVISKQKLHNN